MCRSRQSSRISKNSIRSFLLPAHPQRTSATKLRPDKAGGGRPPFGNSRLRVQEIEHRGLGEHGFRNAVERRALALLSGLGRLKISAEMPRALDDAVIFRQTIRLE